MMRRRQFLATLAGASLTWAAPASRRTDPAWSRQAALDFLAKQQSPDGAWRSDTYGMFRDGKALTPLVLRALHRERPEAAQRGIEWVAKQAADTWTLFPVHNACWLLELAAQHQALAKLKEPLVARLRELQLSESKGWPSRSPYHGGWSYAGRAPDWISGKEIPAMQQPNLSASVLALAGLRAAGIPVDDLAFQHARRFIQSCQNFDTTDDSFDDGGFFQMHEDLMRNKGGKAGIDANGRTRFKSYAAASTDGLRGLLLCGTSEKHPRVQATLKWLAEHPTVSDVADLQCYASYSRSRAIRLLAQSELNPIAPKLPQHDDGSILNPHREMRENDPLVATSMAILATA